MGISQQRIAMEQINDVWVYVHIFGFGVIVHLTQTTIYEQVASICYEKSS